MNFFSVLPFLYLFTLAFLIFVWVSVGTPKLLKRAAMLVIIVPAVHLLVLLFTDYKYIFRFFIKDVIMCSIPFLCVFLNARRFDKSLRLSRALMFWLHD